MPKLVPVHNRLAARRFYWASLLLWAVASILIADRLADHMQFRINDLSVIPGAGMVMRDPEGTFFHVNAAGKARAIYPVLETAYRQSCLDCVLVTGEQMAQTNNFCASGVRTQLPKIEFEQPCASWAVIGDGPKVVAVTLFLLPVLLWPVLRALVRVTLGNKSPK